MADGWNVDSWKGYPRSRLTDVENQMMRFNAAHGFSADLNPTPTPGQSRIIKPGEQCYGWFKAGYPQPGKIIRSYGPGMVTHGYWNGPVGGSASCQFNPVGWKIASEGSGQIGGNGTGPDDDPVDTTRGGDEPNKTDDYPRDLPANSCQCIDSAMSTINISLKIIIDLLEKKTDKACDYIDECIDEIIDELKKRIEGPLKSCDECKQMLASGLGGTLEYAVRCSGACIEETVKECSLGDESTWGKPCEECGAECCICDKGICKPTPCPPEEEKEKPKKYVGWCQASTGLIEVREQKAGSPGKDWTQVALGDDEQAVATEAAANCTKKESVAFPPFKVQPSYNEGRVCTISEFPTGQAATKILSGEVLANLAAGHAQTASAVLRFGFEGISVSSATDYLGGLARAIFGLPGFAANTLGPVANAAIGCPSPTFQRLLQLQSNIAAVGKYTGLDMTQYMSSMQYASNLLCRQKLLDPDKAIAAYLADATGKFDIDTHWAIAGLCNSSLNDYLQAARSKPVPLQLAQMRRRKLIGDSDYSRGMRELGYLEPKTSEKLFKLTEQLPTLSDIIHLMVRDADDDTIEHWPESDRIFQQKYGKQLKEWSEFQGIPEQFAKYAWRAHWTIPAPGQLFTFWHRLRYNDKFGGKDKLLKQIKNALSQQDILPFWQEHYLAVSFHPLTRVDVRRAYNIGSMDEKQVTTAYLDAGYSDDNANILTDFTKRMKVRSLRNHPEVKRWAKLEISPEELARRLKEDGFDDAEVIKAKESGHYLFANCRYAVQFANLDIRIDEFEGKLANWGLLKYQVEKVVQIVNAKRKGHPALKDYAVGTKSAADVLGEIQKLRMEFSTPHIWMLGVDAGIKQAAVVNCQRGIKRRYLTGELDLPEAKAALIKYGTVTDRANMLADSWECEKATQNKAATASKLCEWLGRGAITAREFLNRLERIGYAKHDAAMMLDDCLISVNAKRLAEAKRLAKDDEALRAKQEAATRRANAQAEKLAAQSERASKAAATARANREKQLLSAATKIEKKCDCDVYDSLVAVRENHQRLQRELGLTVDESLRVLLAAADTWDGGPIFSYDFQVDSVAAGALEAEEV